MSTDRKQRIVIGMYDGFGMDYHGSQPVAVACASWRNNGFFKRVSAVFPTVTNANNASICCGTWPKEHGITGNSYFNEQTGEADYMENADFICVPTMIQRAAERGVKSALLTCKVKTIHLLGRGAEIAVAAEAPPAEWVERYGKPANIYSSRNQLLAVASRRRYSQASPRRRSALCSHHRFSRCIPGRRRSRNRKNIWQLWISSWAKRKPLPGRRVSYSPPTTA